jgi:hypothetical protein
MEHGDFEKMEVESAAAYVMAIGGHRRPVADLDQATTTLIDYTGTPMPEYPRPAVRPVGLVPLFRTAAGSRLAWREPSRRPPRG